MKKNCYLFVFLPILFVFIILSCSKTEDDAYVSIPAVKVDLTQVPYPKLSDYKFFVGELKNLNPSDELLAYQPASSLFSDYAHKKRFVWMPEGSKANFAADNKILELPVGAVLIKTFYYDNVQNVTPVGTTRIVETRLMIHKADGWIYADYVWNAEQTEAYYDINGSFTDVTWKDEHNVVKSAHYRIPSLSQCIVCHKEKVNPDTPQETMKYIPIGIKPQNLNWNYNYGNVTKNQLQAWIDKGFLNANFTFPTTEHSTVDYNDASQTLLNRARSYVDANCSHCHMTNRHCDYRPMRFAFSETSSFSGLRNMGVCVDTQDMQGFDPNLNKIINPQHPEQSMLFHRINTVDETIRMPLHGRTIIHEEGINLMRDWINSLDRCE
ncbi:MAG: hypothetical protein U0X58_12625 [Flavobacteriaceae bacterium]